MKVDLRKVFVLVLMIFSAMILLLTTEEWNWLINNIFIITVSLIFISPLITALFEFKRPKEYIVVFILGGVIFVVYSYLFYSTLAEVIEMLFTVILFSGISSFGILIVKKLEDIIPP